MRQCAHCRTHHNMLGAFCSEQCHNEYFGHPDQEPYPDHNEAEIEALVKHDQGFPGW